MIIWAWIIIGAIVLYLGGWGIFAIWLLPNPRSERFLGAPC